MVDEAGRDIDDVPAVALRQHRCHGCPRHLEGPAEIHPGDRVEVVVGVVGEGRGDEDSRVVDHGVDPAEPVEGRIDDALADSWRRDVARNRQHHRIIACADQARVRDNGIAEPAETGHQAFADALRCPGDHRYALLSVHIGLLCVGAMPTNHAGAADDARRMGRVYFLLIGAASHAHYACRVALRQLRYFLAASAKAENGGVGHGSACQPRSRRVMA
jgi:hypothetical protein